MSTPGISAVRAQLPVSFAGKAPSAHPVFKNGRASRAAGKGDIYATTASPAGKRLASWGNKLEKALFFLAALPLLLVALVKVLMSDVIPVLKDFFKWQTLLKQAYPQRGKGPLAVVLSHLVIARIAEKTGTKPLPGLDATPLPTASHYYGNIIRGFPKLLLWGKNLPVNLADRLIKTTPENDREALRQAMADYRRAFRERHTKTPPNDQSRYALDQKLQKALDHLNGLLPPPPQLEGRQPWYLSPETGMFAMGKDR